MTHQITQRSGNDCVLAAIAMALGFERWEQAWTEEDLATVIESHGISDMGPWLKRHGLNEREDYLEVSCWNEERLTTAFLWGRRALVSINSLNVNQGSHMVYWDGFKVWDPNTGIEGKIALPFLSAARISRVVLFKS